MNLSLRIGQVSCRGLRWRKRPPVKLTTSSCSLCQRWLVSSSHVGLPDQSKDLIHSICRKIRFSGPISVAQYMREALTNPQAGYYIHGDMLGAHGDFITSPELNQMFGELLAIWFISEWKALGSPTCFRFVELGPGRGTLAEDILKVFNGFQKIFTGVEMSFHFVELSKKLSETQLEKLCNHQSVKKNGESNSECFQSGYAKHGGVPLQWHRSLDDVPNDSFTFFLAHEFLDALPIHKFVKTEKGWRELYVDVKPGSEDKLRFIQLQEVTLATKLIKDDEKRKHVEICPEAAGIVSNLSQRIETNGGAGLIVDYGYLGDKEDTLRGFKDHKLNDVFENIGESDLTADVDFSFLLQSIGDTDIEKSGPISQQAFLKNMGIELRLMMLLRNCRDKETAKKLVDSYKIIMDEKHMGERFKFLALTSKTRQDESPVTGFFDEPS